MYVVHSFTSTHSIDSFKVAPLYESSNTNTYVYYNIYRQSQNDVCSAQLSALRAHFKLICTFVCTYARTYVPSTYLGKEAARERASLTRWSCQSSSVEIKQCWKQHFAAPGYKKKKTRNEIETDRQTDAGWWPLQEEVWTTVVQVPLSFFLSFPLLFFKYSPQRQCWWCLRNCLSVDRG